MVKILLYIPLWFIDYQIYTEKIEKLKLQPVAGYLL